MMRTFDFDQPLERRGTGCEKWDGMQPLFGISPSRGLPMWVADTDFPAPAPVHEALRRILSHGIYGYHGTEDHYRDAITYWMSSRHGWIVDPEWILSTHGLVNGFAIVVDTMSQPGDGVVLFTPVYHAFARVITAAERTITELPLVVANGRYEMDLANAASRLRGNEKILVLCSPHNPGGTVWAKTELQAVADFAEAHNLLVVSDEIHHDLVFPGSVHTPTAMIENVRERLVVMTAATKTFNIAGCHCGQLIVSNSDLRGKLSKRIKALGISADTFGIEMTAAAYSQESLPWLREMIGYFDENRRLFDKSTNAISGVSSMHLDGTYLAWVDFKGTGLAPTDIRHRIEKVAEIAASHGPSFGTGGATWARFNLGMRRSLLNDAVERLALAFE